MNCYDRHTFSLFVSGNCAGRVKPQEHKGQLTVRL